ncbi:glucose-1-phosphate cytidylyltransferase [soil metagenome]
MKTIILCGGTGTRLKEETEYKPKPMVLVGNKPIIWHIMKIYATYGFTDFILALGYKANYIKEFFLNQKAFTSDFSLETKMHKTKYYLKNRPDIDDFNITFVDTGLESLPGERIYRCREYIPKTDKHFMVTYGDGVTNLPIKDLVSFHKKQKTLGTITGVHPRSKYGLIKTTSDNYVTGFREKPVLSEWVNGGYMVFNREVFNYLKNYASELDMLQQLATEKKLSVFKHNDFWFAVDTYKELEDLNIIWNKGNPPWRIWK